MQKCIVWTYTKYSIMYHINLCKKCIKKRCKNSIKFIMYKENLYYI